MIVQHMAALNGKRIVLASGSPRRREILTMLGLAHEVHVSAFEENLDKATFPTPADYAKTNAAFDMLSSLSGQEHSVLSAVALFTPSRSEVRDKPASVFCEHTRVRFAPLSPETIAAYIRTGEPMDKAGSYGIQGVGGSFITGITGCYYNVMGFPLHAFTSAVAGLLDAGEL
eukprot:TRINITY_DN2772_c0_g1_i1.p1 TRINITY_DN2772_c0_g1~~TRINITY_DN2772_c0_g1_i1.p1  ORF type:complete len:191 (-),score=59.62 TRINITY_DN2772_c0_g1_i1:67-582(-)